MEIGININVEQKLVMSQNQLQSIKLLELNNLELNQFLQNEYLENPLLEYTQSTEAKPQEVLPDDSNTNGYSDGKGNHSVDICAEDPDEWRRYILYQLNPKDYTASEWLVMQYMVYCLDEDGYFSMPIDEVADLTHVNIEVVDKCLKILSDLEPVGIFSSNLTDCLLKQLSYMKNQDEVLKAIIINHLEDVANGYINRISRDLHISTVQIKKYIRIIQGLNPKPLQSNFTRKTEYIVPDLILKQTGSAWNININDKWMGNYALNDYYLAMMQDCQDEELLQYFKKALERSRFIISCIEQRRKTILKITKSIVNRQEDYFAKSGCLKPMTMAEVAEDNDIHVSTVSRTIKGKYLQCEKIGTILMKGLFTSKVSEMKKESFNAEHIKEEIRHLLQNENDKKPYSDQQLVDFLCNKNILIARRTVAKYRKELNIAKISERKIRNF